MTAFYLTTPIYYVNAKPHLGHAYSTIVADAVTRFHTLRGAQSMLVTGTDEHGDKIVQAAEKNGQSIEEFTTSVSGEFRALWPKLEITPDRFIRTTDPKHAKVVQAFLQRVYDNGDIYFGEYGGHYCYGCERFYTDKELENGLCPQHLVAPEFISEKNYFFKMSKYQDWLKQYILDNPDFIRPERYRNEALGMLEAGVLDDLCISRPKTRLTWGVELPFDNNYVCYVWFDALLSYLTAIGGPDSAEFQTYWPNAEHLVAKDILKPHAIFWPCMLKSAGLPVYQHLNVHGYWLARGTKMSKSLGNIVVPLDIATKYGVDPFRYFLLKEMHFGSDSSFSEEGLVGRINADLANDLGNLFSRVLSMTAKYFDSVTPAPGPLAQGEEELLALAENSFMNFCTLFEHMKFSNALESLWELIRALNKYVDIAAPWTLAKVGNTERLGTVLYTLLDLMRRTAIHLWPVMPHKAEDMLHQLGKDFTITAMPLAEGKYVSLASGIKVAPSSNLFPRIEQEEKKEQKALASRKKSKEQLNSDTLFEPPVGVIEFEDFQKIDLRVGTVLSCEPHQNADKLLKLMVDIGEKSPRQILAGMAEFFSAKYLIGRQVVIVANLAPRIIRGLESQGMVLAVKKEGGLELLAVTDSVLAGSSVS